MHIAVRIVIYILICDRCLYTNHDLCAGVLVEKHDPEQAYKLYLTVIQTDCQIFCITIAARLCRHKCTKATHLPVTNHMRH